MSKFKWVSVIALSVALSGTAFAAGPRGGGGGGGGMRGGGGGAHFGGGGGAHFGGGGGGMHFGGGGARFGGGGAHFGGGGARFAGGGAHFGGGHFGGARVGGAHFGGGHFAGARGGGFRGGAARFAGGGRHGGGGAAFAHTPGGRAAAFSRAAGGSSFRNSHAALGHVGGNLNRQGLNHQGMMRANAVHHALAGGAVAGALHNHNALRNPDSRAHIAAAAATAGWRGHDRNGGWWRHAHGGYGWVGPLFWPFAYSDLSDYAMWGYDPSLWDYGYGDIYAGIFAPYDYADLAGYLPYGGGYASYGGGGYSSSGGGVSGGAGTAPSNAPNEIAQMCGDDSQEIAGLPIDRIQQAINPDDEQRKALDDLANASVRAAQAIKAACPNDVASTAPARLAAMQARLEAMISAVRIVQPPLDHFYGLLNDEQKARLTSLGEDQRRGRNDQGALAQNCANAGQATEWPAAEIERRVHPTEAQRASLDNLKDATAKAADILKETCEPNEALTPPARLAAAGKRLDAMLQAVETVKSALDSLYSELSDEQKAQFESIGPGRDVAASAASSSDNDGAAAPRHYRRRHHASVYGLVRRLIGF
ncbi:MAG TPA: Spy/CpxP family protein refolding chaperone [Bradyrhizobium sp.]|uniref:Spy/CpxP family protein refolding chaperone n=1 Tax=Bradyrhizobium sp. TaxID=376 RepID=UPI002D7FDF6F|nr:Spy/CpxP family protein refolding chaperone [Bradyrhizobium sp.]HET7887646.1 Spy/CpxP family protein refolding chaperone [Bradyrhizobium sp.]